MVDATVYDLRTEVRSLADLFHALEAELAAMMGDADGVEDARDNPHRLALLFDSEFRALARAAYQDGVEGDLRQVIEAAEAADTGILVGDAPVPADFLQRLAAHGLTGQALEFKLSAVSRWRDERNAILDALPRMSAPSFIRSAQKKVLEAIDLILGSFGDALGIGGAVEEFKKMFEHAV